MREEYGARSLSAGQWRFFAVMRGVTVDYRVERRPAVTGMAFGPVHAASARAYGAALEGTF